MNRIIYFDNAATTFPKPAPVYKAVDEYVRKHCGNPSRGAHSLALEAADAVYKSREAIAELFSASPENVSFTMNTTYALNFAIKSMVKPGDHILISDLEHNSVYRPVNEVCRRLGCAFDIFSATGGADGILEDINGKRKHNTKLLVCTHQSNILPLTLPVESICKYCREHGIRTVIDCAQSAGTVSLDMNSCKPDAVCIPSHKGLYGIQGSGAVIFGDIDVEALSTTVEGGSGSESIPPHMPDYLPDRFEAGTLPSPSIASLAYGIKFVREKGINTIFSHEYKLCERIIKRLSAFDDVVTYNKSPGQTLLFNIRGKDPSNVAAAFDENGVCLRAGLHCSPLAHKTIGTFPKGAVRASFGAFNTIAEAERFCDITEYIIKKRLV